MAFEYLDPSNFTGKSLAVAAGTPTEFDTIKGQTGFMIHCSEAFTLVYATTAALAKTAMDAFKGMPMPANTVITLGVPDPGGASTPVKVYVRRASGAAVTLSETEGAHYCPIIGEA